MEGEGGNSTVPALLSQHSCADTGASSASPPASVAGAAGEGHSQNSGGRHDDRQAAEAALQLKWAALRQRPLADRPAPSQQRQELLSMSKEALAAAIFSSPMPTAAAQVDEAAARRSPPLQPLYTSEPSVPWAAEDVRAGWGRTLRRVEPRAHRSPLAQPFPHRCLDGNAQGEQHQTQRRRRSAEASPYPTPDASPPLRPSRLSSLIADENGWLDKPSASADASTREDEDRRPAAAGDATEGERDSADSLSASARAGAAPVALSVPAPPPHAREGQGGTAEGLTQPLECVPAQPIVCDFRIAVGNSSQRAHWPRAEPSAAEERVGTAHSSRAPPLQTVQRGRLGPPQPLRGALDGAGGSGPNAFGRHMTQAPPSADVRSGRWAASLLSRHLRSDEVGGGYADVADRGLPESGDGNEEESGGMLEGDLRCDRYIRCCCRGCLSWCPCGAGRGVDSGGGEGERARLLSSSERGGHAEHPTHQQWPPQQRASRTSTTVGADCCRALRRSVTRMWHFVDVFHAQARYNTHLPDAARLYCLLHYAAAVGILLPVVTLAAREAPRTRQVVVNDGTACQDHTFQDVLRADLMSSLCCFAVNVMFALWFALRAARYEKSGFLVAAAVVVALQVTRAVYFIFYVAPSYMDWEEWWLSAPMNGMLGFGTTLSVIATLLSWRVRSAFGWRSFSQGITQPGTLALRRRYMRLQTCLQLDGVVTLNAYLSTLFLCDTWPQQAVAATVTALVLLALWVLMPLLRVARHWWPLVPCVAVLLGSLGYYTFTVSANLSSFGVYSAEDDDAQSSDAHEDSGASAGEGSVDQVWRLLLHAGSPAAGEMAGTEGERPPLDWTSFMGRCYQKQLPACLAQKDVRVITPYTVDGGTHSALARGTGMPSHPHAPWPSSSWPSQAVLTSANAGALEAAVRVAGVVPVNGSSTYLPTHGARADEYFELRQCNYTSCFLPRQDEFVCFLHGCCEDYGRCSRRAASRLYGVTLLILLSFAAFVVRVTLVAVAWRRVAANDDKAIAEFLQSHRAAGGGVGTPAAATATAVADHSPFADSSGAAVGHSMETAPEVRRQLRWGDAVADT